MFVLLKKELGNFFASAAGYIIIAVFLTITGSFLWLIPSEYNILDSLYADVEGLFMLSPWIFLFLVPALTMKMFADERVSGTIELLYTKPVKTSSIVLSKFFAGWILTIIALIPTLLYMISVGLMGETPFNLDSGAFWGSYIGLLFLASGYTAVGIFCSSVSKNSIVSFTLSALICFLAYYGFEVISLLLPDVSAAKNLCSLGISAHYDSMSRGVIDLRDVIYFIFFDAVFILGTATNISRNRVSIIKWWVVVALFGMLTPVLSALGVVLRLDLTQEHRYSLSDNTKQLVRSLDNDVNVDIYLAPDINSGFLSLRDATENLLKEMNAYSGGRFNVRFINPLEHAKSEKELYGVYEDFYNRGLIPKLVNEHNSEGGVTEKLAFPWAVMSMAGDTVAININLLKEIRGIQGWSGMDNLNASVESLEYEFTDALRRLVNKNIQTVAFLVGHGEYGGPEVCSVTEALAKYYNVYRGALTGSANELENFKVVIIAGPVNEFSERDKYLIDQYVMRGGRVLWLLDGVLTDGKTTVVANSLSLDDMLFTYGIRISPLVLLDTECLQIPIDVEVDAQNSDKKFFPWYYCPLLTPDPKSPITANISRVMTSFPSVIELVAGSKECTASYLLYSSARAALSKVPIAIDMDILKISQNDEHFSFQHLPVAALVEGSFNSVFAGRMVPPEIETKGGKPIAKSAPTKMIFVSDGDIIKNEVIADADGFTPYPLGFDAYSGITYGNSDFIVNAVNYLCDDDGWMELRGRAFVLRMLDKNKVIKERTLLQIVNLVAPLVLLIIFGVVYQLIRKKRWISPLKKAVK